MKRAFLFPGQGVQVVGMGKDIYEKYEEARKIYDKANEITKGSWIDLINPTPEQIDIVVNNTNIDKEILVKLLDEEELPRIEKRKEETVIISDTPYILPDPWPSADQDAPAWSVNYPF